MGALLVLEDGTVFNGEAFGHRTTIEGEVVFNTGMVGYTESISDPSYKGQILCQTYPLIGNYGVDAKQFESSRPQIEGYIVSELCREPNHPTMLKGLDEVLAEGKIPGIAGIDTRQLTRKLRMQGVMLGLLSTDSTEREKLLERAKKIKDPNDRDLVAEVSVEQPVNYGSGRKTVVVVDCGVKMNIIRSLAARGLNVIRVPAHYTADNIMSYRPDGVLISNGPGDPKKVDYVIKATKSLIEYKTPIFGVCLGVQVLALAMGGTTYKLKFGHRGQNHPCMDAANKCYVTSQNHGFCIDEKSLPPDVKVSFVNVNDKTVEGIEHSRLPVFGVQFHPEDSPGPRDTMFLFDKFCRMMDGK